MVNEIGCRETLPFQPRHHAIIHVYIYIAKDKNELDSKLLPWRSIKDESKVQNLEHLILIWFSFPLRKRQPLFYFFFQLKLQTTSYTHIYQVRQRLVKYIFSRTYKRRRDQLNLEHLMIVQGKQKKRLQPLFLIFFFQLTSIVILYTYKYIHVIKKKKHNFGAAVNNSIGEVNICNLII